MHKAETLPMQYFIQLIRKNIRYGIVFSYPIYHISKNAELGHVINIAPCKRVKTENKKMIKSGSEQNIII